MYDLFHVLYGVIMNDKEKQDNPPLTNLEKNKEKLEEVEDMIMFLRFGPKKQ